MSIRRAQNATTAAQHWFTAARHPRELCNTAPKVSSLRPKDHLLVLIAAAVVREGPIHKQSCSCFCYNLLNNSGMRCHIVSHHQLPEFIRVLLGSLQTRLSSNSMAHMPGVGKHLLGGISDRLRTPQAPQESSIPVEVQGLWDRAPQGSKPSGVHCGIDQQQNCQQEHTVNKL